MVIILLIIGAISFFLASMFTFKPVTRITTILVTGIILVGSIGLMIGNSRDHFGMHKVQTTSTQTIYSASNSESMPLALYKPVGTSGKDDVYIYNSKPTQKTAQHTQANQYTHNKVKWTNNTTAKLTTVETRWEYKNSFYKYLYMWSGMGHTLISRTNTFTYPKTWVKITVDQADSLKKQMNNTQTKTAMATQAKQYVETKVAAAMTKNPQMSATDQAKIVKQAQIEFQSKALKQAVAQLK
ncbi:DUF4811 domain-containing protein [Paucilactobacillus kaifaensis]|uniref:DUF4811 domain-containing protein n=1 Tax=Paucilactobacillus kaifaensis TaxID=2559921 RepID=UPI0010FA262D|nr:DUF4811 domain-containing protein [Paucilactobacillus kaifaensis]